jgi:hypothetical protein
MERVEGVEPSSLAWKAKVIAVIRHPHQKKLLIQVNVKWLVFTDSNCARLLCLPMFRHHFAT